MKHNFPRLLLVLCALVIGLGTTWAERVTQEDAALVAANFFNAPDTTQADTTQAAQAPGRSRQMRRVPLAPEAQYYVYANADGNGWVMVAANDLVKPILAYSDEGEFLADNMPSNVTHWLGHYDKFIKKLEDEGVTQTKEAAAQWRALRKAPPSTAKGNIVVDVLVQTQWDQGAPYNNLCPGSGNTKAYTGCVATAMAQVMNFWQWPVTGNGSRTYQPKDPTSDSGGTSKRYGQQTANFGSTTYDWANMKKKHSSSDNTTQKTAISTLMYHCGVATDMMYGNDADGGSATYTVNYGDWDWSDSEGECAQNALYNFFRYKKPTGYMRDGYSYGGRQYYKSWSDDDWTAMVKAELDEGRPIMYGGSGSGGGHSFICDGYDDQDYFHFNWGWSGSNDGWYTLSNLVPGSGGAGGGSYSFSDGQDVIIGIEPAWTGHNVVLNGTGCTLSANKQRVDNGYSVTVTITPTDETYDYTSTTVKLGSTTISSSKYSLTNNNTTLTIDGSAITGSDSNDLTITVVWTKNRYKYEMLGESCTEELSGTLEKNAALNLTIKPATGYTLANADCWVVTMGGNTLTYNSGFTYNASTGAFSIASVTGDVEIYAFGGHQVTWYANGSLYTTNMSISDKITLPGNPADCSGTNGKKFVGWCTSSDYSHATTAPTFAKDEDEYSVATYYAVYATPAGNGAPRRAAAGMSEVASVTFANASSDGTADKSSSISDLVSSASGISSYSGSKVYAGTTGVKIGSGSAVGSITLTLASSATVKEVKVTAKKYGSDTGKLSVTAGSTTIGSAQSPLADGGDLIFTAETAVEGVTTITVATSSKRAYISSITVYEETSGGGGGSGGGDGSYTDYSTTCTTCTNTPSMSFTPATVSKTTADGSFTKTVTISGNGSGQTVAYSSNDETVATVTNSGVVTLKGKVGSTTITASVAADGDYCAASASYTLNVTAAPIDVTLYYNGTSASLTGQTNPYTLPTDAPYNTAMCSGDWTFDGWYGSAYTKSTEKPTYLTQLTATGSAYAVYKTTETSGSGGSSEVASVTFANASADGTADKSSAISELVSSATGISSYSGSKVYAGTTGIKIGTGSAVGSITLTLSSAADVKTVKVTAKKYSSDTGTLSVTAGSTSVGSAQTPPSDAGELTFTASSAVEGTTTITVATSAKRAYISSITVITDGGSSSTTYYATSPECATPCSTTPTMSFTNETVNKTTSDASYTQAVNIQSQGAGQTVVYSSSDESVGTVDNSGVVTLQGKIGTTTITASVEANGDYCEASASYTLNVAAAPISVTLHYNNESATLNNQPSPYTLPTGAPYNTAMCNGDWTFDGWYGSAYTKSTEKPSYITQLTAMGSAYAVYKTTETSGSGGSSEVASVTFANASADGTADKSSAISELVSSATGISSYSGSKVYAGTTGIKIGTGSAVGSITLTLSSAADVKTVKVTAKKYSSDTGTLSVTAGSTSVGSAQTPPSDAGELTFTASSAVEGTTTITVATSAKRAYISSITVITDGGSSSTTYYATSPECVTPCSTTPTMSFTNTSMELTTDDETYTQTVNITGKGSGQTVAYSSSDETVAIVSTSGVVTLQGKAGTATITASVEEDGDYCEASASYTITVTACALTGITLNTENVTTAFTNEDDFTSAGLVVTANYSNCSSKVVTPTSISTPDLSTGGEKTVTVTYEENGTTKTETYTINVTVIVYHTVTWIACGDIVKTGTYREGDPLELPSSTPGGNAGKSFVGWTATAHYTGASAPPDLFSTAGDKTVTGNVTYYAVYE